MSADPGEGPVVAARGQSPATASRPDRDERTSGWHVYDGNAAPWWVALMWITFLIAGAAYLVVNLR